MKKYILGGIAIIIAAVVVASGYSQKNTYVTDDMTNKGFVDYYFKFMGTHGQESDISKWDQITLAEYNAPGCTGDSVGCRIKTNSASGTPLRPTAVPTEPNGKPKQSGTVTAVKNKN